MLAAAVMQQAWREGRRRVCLFCADELRPAACCIVDALLTRGYEVSLLTGAEAREGLQAEASAEVLRVIWAPETSSRDTRLRLRDALDPDAAGDVLVLAAPTPRGVIEAIDAFGSPPRRRPRIQPRRHYLAQPTLIERRLDAGRWTASGLGALAIVLTLAFGLWLGAADGPAAPAPAVPETTLADGVAAETMSAPRSLDEPVLASGRAVTLVAYEDDEDDEPIIILDEIDDVDDAPVRPRAAEPTPLGGTPTADEAAPLVRATTTAGSATMPMGGMPMGGMPLGGMPSSSRTGARVVDPF